MEKNCTVENCKQLNKRNEKNLHLKYPASKIVSFIILTLFCIVWIAPFVLLVTVSLRNQNDAMLYPEQFLYPLLPVSGAAGAPTVFFRVRP